MLDRPDLSERGGDAVRPGEVDRDPGRSPAELRGDLLRVLGVPARDDDVPAAAGEDASNLEADARGAPDDDAA